MDKSDATYDGVEPTYEGREVPSLNSGRVKKSETPGISLNTDRGFPSEGSILDVGGSLDAVGFVTIACFSSLMCESYAWVREQRGYSSPSN